ncbi:type II toxin-antitoxin system VapC family toxin [Metallosphaera hakonensis]|uniref:type II toxin-antitoxin system VapC family toxin n=1 Tax=Metallosphaera hakonensis TaxID=79601 RepID=UPI000B2C5180|nr:type II toxin-antitoxin system VapC family toxin [Metallosphaera hakonensis]
MYGERAKELLEIVETEEAYSSTLIISQVLAHLERRGKNHVIPVFINYLQQSGMNIAETNWEDIINALRILQSSGLSYKLWDDATIFAQMKRLKIDTIYSNDKDFDLFNIKRKF